MCLRFVRLVVVTNRKKMSPTHPWLFGSNLALLLALVLHQLWTLEPGDFLFSPGESRGRRAPLLTSPAAAASSPLQTHLAAFCRYSVLTRGDFDASSDAQGCVAVGGNVRFAAGYSVGDQIPPPAVSGTCHDAMVVVGGQVQSWPSGRVFCGNVVLGRQSSVNWTRLLDPGCRATVQTQLPLNFTGIQEAMCAWSVQLSQMNNTVQHQRIDQDLKLTLFGKQRVEVWNAPSATVFLGVVSHVLPLVGYTTGTVLVINVPGRYTGVANVNMENWKGTTVLFNFYEASVVDIRGVALHGHVLAPFARIPSATGVIYGNIYAQSMSGSVQVNWVNPTFCTADYFSLMDCHQPPTIEHIVPAPVSIPRPQDAGICVNIGDLAHFNGIFLKNFSASSDAQGKLAVGGDAKFAAGYSIADQLTNIGICKVPTLIIGERLLGWPSGRNYYGHIFYGKGTPVHGPVLDSGCNITLKPNYYDFEFTHDMMKTLSAYLVSLKPTVSINVLEDHSAAFTFRGGLQVEVLNVTDPQCFMGPISKFNTPANYKQGVILVINVAGAFSGLTNMNQEAFADMPVIFNFWQATVLSIRGVGVRGYILAPYAEIPSATGVIWGSIYAMCMDGPIQLNYVPLRFCHKTPECSIDIGPLSKWNAIFSGSFVGQTDTGGRLAIGGNATFSAGYSIGSALKNIGQCVEFTLVVGDSILAWPSGRNYYGNIAYAKSINAGYVLDPTCRAEKKSDVLKFNDITNQMIALSKKLKEGTQTMMTSVKDAELTLILDGSLDVEYFNAPSGNYLGSTIKCIAKITNYYPGTIIVFNIPDTAASLSDLDMEALTNLPVIFNFHAATTLRMTGVTVRGYVIAPYASLSPASGDIYGHVFAKSHNSGSNRFQFYWTPADFCGASIDPIHCFDIGPLTVYNLITRENYQGSSDVQGRLAVGGNADLYGGFSAGDRWAYEKFCTEPVVVVGKRLIQWPNGRAYYGNIYVGDLANSQWSFRVLEPGCKVMEDKTYANFELFHMKMTALSAKWRSLPETASFGVDGAWALQIVLSGAMGVSPHQPPVVEVINVSNPELFLKIVKSVGTVRNYYPGKILIFNIAGQTSGFLNLNLDGFLNIPVIFNFYEATSLTIAGVGVRGYIVAPYANVRDATGVVWGSVYVNSLTGSLQINWVHFNWFCGDCHYDPNLPILYRRTPVPPPSNGTNNNSTSDGEKTIHEFAVFKMTWSMAATTLSIITMFMVAFC